MDKSSLTRTGTQCVSVSLKELLQLSEGAKKLSLSALRVASSQSGQHLSRLLGRGMEFAESRRYQAGDDIRNIDWRVTARTGKAHTKLFAAEKEREILLWADMRSPMFFATQGVFKCVQAALMLGYISWNAVQTGNRVGGMIFDDKNYFEFRPTSGKKGLLPYLERLAKSTSPFSTQPAPANEKVLDHAISGILRVASPGSLIFMISDFRYLSEQARDLLIQVSRHSDLCLCFIYDQLEVALPKNGYYPVANDNKEMQLNTFDKKRIEKYHLQFIERRNKVKSLEGRQHIHFMECSTQDDCLEILKKRFK